MLRHSLGMWAKTRSWFYYDQTEEGKWSLRMIKWAFATWELRAFEARTRDSILSDGWVRDSEYAGGLSKLSCSVELSLASVAACAAAAAEYEFSNSYTMGLELPSKSSLPLVELLSFYFFLWKENVSSGLLRLDRQRWERSKASHRATESRRLGLKARLCREMNRLTVPAVFGSSRERFTDRPDRRLLQRPLKATTLAAYGLL